MATKDPKKNEQRILVLDIGGTNVKLMVPGLQQPIKIPSGPDLTPKAMVQQVNRALTGRRPYDVVSIGYPGPVVHGHPMMEPDNLGSGWVGFNFRKALGRPVKIVNDAAMQALGGYERGKLLFLGLGTGLGSAMIVGGILEPMELAHLPYKNGKTYEDCLGLRGLKRLGRRKWEREVGKVVAQLRAALEPEQIILGGGNAKKLKKLPPGTIRGTTRMHLREGSGCGAKTNESRNDFYTEWNFKVLVLLGS
jgi:polyphosphate glucokinase